MAQFWMHNVDALLSPAKLAVGAVGAAAGPFAAAPFWLPVVLADRCPLGSPVLFREARPSLYESPSEPSKLRTVPDPTGADGSLCLGVEVLRRFGEWLRRTSLGDLPEARSFR